MKKTLTAEAPVGCYWTDDTRGKGWYCCKCNTWHPAETRVCRYCKHGRC